uniref:Uncharacterized protein n=1 Tax=Anguilla anguilla TaxID=7936 RepID=A0A0E9TZB9_ANGAN
MSQKTCSTFDFCEILKTILHIKQPATPRSPWRSVSDQGSNITDTAR